MIDLIVVGILGLIDLALLAGFYLYSKQVAQERKELLNVLISRNAGELRDLQLTDKVETIKPPTTGDFIPVAELDEETFDSVNGI